MWHRNLSFLESIAQSWLIFLTSRRLNVCLYTLEQFQWQNITNFLRFSPCNLNIWMLFVADSYYAFCWTSWFKLIQKDTYGFLGRLLFNRCFRILSLLPGLCRFFRWNWCLNWSLMIKNWIIKFFLSWWRSFLFYGMLLSFFQSFAFNFDKIIHYICISLLIKHNLIFLFWCCVL